MQYLKRNTKYSILSFLVILLSITISISTLAKTKVYPACACLHADRFSLYDNPQILSTTSPRPEVQTININTASQDDLIKILAKLAGSFYNKNQLINKLIGSENV